MKIRIFNCFIKYNRFSWAQRIGVIVTVTRLATVFMFYNFYLLNISAVL